MEYKKSDEMYELYDLYTVIERPYRHRRTYKNHKTPNKVYLRIPPLNLLCTPPVPNLIVT